MCAGGPADLYGWPDARCSFPPWLSTTQWIDVTQRSALYVTSGDNVTILDQRRPPPTLTNHSTPQVCLSYVHFRYVFVIVIVPIGY